MGEVKTLLVELATLLGIPGELHAYESWDDWKFYGPIPSPPPLPGLEKLVPRLRAQYGDALLLRLKSSDDSIVFRLDRDHPDPSFDDLRALDPGTRLTADLKIDKSVLAVKEQWTADTAVTRLFLFHEKLAWALAVPLDQLDATLFARSPSQPATRSSQPIVILLPAHDIDLDSGWLTVIGGKHLPRWRERLELRDEPTMLDLAHDHVNWVAFELTRLTPLHLLPRVGYAADGDPVAAALHAQLFLCSALYLAAQSTKAGDRWTCRFSSDRQETAVEIGARPMTSKDDWAAARTLGELARWTYEKPADADDRLIVVQRIVVDALQHNAAINSSELLRLAGELSKRVRWGWEAFIGGELKKYLSQLKELEEVVEETTRDYAGQVHALTKTAIDNVLGAVAVIVGSFLAAIFQSPFQEYAFRFGTGAYAIYFFVFPMAMGLSATWQHFQKSRTAFALRRKSFTARLTEAPVDAVVKPTVTVSESWFRKWYWTTVAAYVAVLAVLVCAFVLVPPAIRSHTVDETAVVRSARVDSRHAGLVIVRGSNFDAGEEIVVTLGETTFTNATEPPTLKVLGSTVLTFKAVDRDLAAPTVTVRQGTAAPQTIPLRR